jgi:hypothetical protein
MKINQKLSTWMNIQMNELYGIGIHDNIVSFFTTNYGLLEQNFQFFQC